MLDNASRNMRQAEPHRINRHAQLLAYQKYLE